MHSGSTAANASVRSNQAVSGDDNEAPQTQLTKNNTTYLQRLPIEEVRGDLSQPRQQLTEHEAGPAAPAFGDQRIDLGR